MDRRKAIWGGLFIGSSIGGFLPNLWGAGYFSFSSVIWTAVGSLVGIWLGYKISG